MKNFEPLVLSGPSGVGKSFIIRLLSHSYDFKKVLPITTRAPRIGEVNLIDYNFLSIEDYLKQESQNHFYMSNNFLGNYYAQSHKEIENVLVLNRRPIIEIFTPVISQFIAYYPNSKRVFLRPISIDLLKDRMISRGEDANNVIYRIEQAKKELDYFERDGYKYYHKVFDVISNSVQGIVEEINTL